MVSCWCDFMWIKLYVSLFIRCCIVMVGRWQGIGWRRPITSRVVVEFGLQLSDRPLFLPRQWATPNETKTAVNVNLFQQERVLEKQQWRILLPSSITLRRKSEHCLAWWSLLDLVTRLLMSKMEGGGLRDTLSTRKDKVTHDISNIVNRFGILYHIDKTAVLQEARVFNDTPINPRKCRVLLTKIIYLLYLGEPFNTKEATDLFFNVIKLFQSKDVS